ncbi:Cell division coordinator CpoB [subsurface metagenome]
MLEYKMRFVVVLAVVSLLSALPVVGGETWRLEQGRDWKAVSDEGRDKYLLAVAQIKKLVVTGQAEQAGEAFDKLKKDFPEISGPDLDAFIEGELLFCKGKFTRAVRAYDKFLRKYPESELYEAALDREFAIATAFLAGQRIRVLGIFKMKGYASGVKTMERISDRAGDAPIAKKAAVAVAKSYEKRRKFNEAYYKWSEISSRWPTGTLGRDALLGMARCKHAEYQGPKYDVSNLVSAKSYYENFRLRYSEDAVKIGVDGRLEQINEQLAYKRFSIGRYYQKTGNEESANLYYRMVIRDWPDSKATEMAKEKINQELKIKKQNDK